MSAAGNSADCQIGVVQTRGRHVLSSHFYYGLRLAAGLAGILTVLGGGSLLVAGNYKGVFLCSLVYALCGGAFTALDHLYADSKCKWSDDLDADRLQNLIQKGGYRYCLILRSFTADANVRLANTLNPFIRFGIGFGMPIVDVQEWVLRYSPQNCRFLSWGGKLGPIRPVRVIAGDYWFDELQKVARLCDVVVMIADWSESVSLELKFLLEELVHHSVILFPPRRGNELQYRRIERSPILRPLLGCVPEKGCLLLPYRGPDGGLAAATYPLTPRSLVQVLEARSNASAA